MSIEITGKYTGKMEVIKRDGTSEEVSFDKIMKRIKTLCKELGLTRVDPIEITKETISGLYNKISTIELDIFAAQKCAEKIIDDPEYNRLAAGICVSNLHKMTTPDFLDVTTRLYNNKDKFNKHSPLVTEQYLNVVKENSELIQSKLDFSRDYLFDFFAIKTLERSYLIRLKEGNYFDHFAQNTTTTKNENDIKDEVVLHKKYGGVVERPQHLIMRVAIGIHGNDLESAFDTYELMSQQYFTHATPTLYNAGSPRPQLSSCFLLDMDDSLRGIFETVTDIANISKWAGGIGVTLSNIRCKDSLIRGTNGNSDGIIPLIRLLNAEARYVNQGGKRNGSIAVYIEVWHADIFDFCELKKKNGSEETRARDMFLALWTCDLFMKRVRDKDTWSLMCPDECPGLTKTYGDEFEQLYTKYEQEGRFKRQVRATDLWRHILSCQIETGVPYLLFKDNVNRLSNQKNIGIIQSSNLCCEICEYTDPDEIAVCNLVSICLSRFVDQVNKTFDFQKLFEVAQTATKNLNKIIDINYYPVDKAKKSNIKHRPIGVGVQGLADAYCKLELPFDKEGARDLNKKIFETIYFGCLTASNELAKKFGPYSTFAGSPFSEGKLQYHLWGLTEKDLWHEGDQLKWDWPTLIKNIVQYGTYNSLLTSLMPTATTSQIMLNNEAFEPFTTNLYTRSTLVGEYIVINRYLIEKLISLGLWTKEIKEELLFDNGSIQKINAIPQNIKDVFKTAYELKLKPVVQQAAERGPFIDQSQSMNLFLEKPDYDSLTSSHFYSWSHQLKTGMYYLRGRPAIMADKFGLDAETKTKIIGKRNNVSSNTNIDPRRINEIEVNQTEGENKDENKSGEDNYKPCEMCSG